MHARHREVMLSLLVKLAIFFSHVRQQWDTLELTVHGHAGSRTELETVKRKRVSMKDLCLNKCVNWVGVGRSAMLCMREKGAWR